MSRDRGMFRGGWNAACVGDNVILTDGSGQGSCTVYTVYAMRAAPLFGEGPGGVTVIWAVTTPSAPFTLDPKAAVGSLGSGTPTNAITPDAFQLQNNEVAQMRFKVKMIDTSAGSGAHIDNFDLSAFNPGSTRAWGSKNVQAILNPRAQVGDPADAISLPLQDTNMGAPTAAAAIVGGFDDAVSVSTELMWYYQNVPNFVLKWNGAAATPAGLAVGLECSGYIYYIKPKASLPGMGAISGDIGGYAVSVPGGVDVRDIIPLQIAAPN